LVIVEVVAREVGEYRHVERDSENPLLLESAVRVPLSEASVLLAAPSAALWLDRREARHDTAEPDAGGKGRALGTGD
jgi:hypothetical protein